MEKLTCSNVFDVRPNEYTVNIESRDLFGAICMICKTNCSVDYFKAIDGSQYHITYIFFPEC
ncbi:hypothetical protein CASFOL_015386 [Castilleja foliolosa]|uniref:Uncharacterized protein n=1 Tax=Castilleja foliolosa TaxID=1961234 RepID=A0ABD3DDY2_9LAMI